ncbi:MAG: 6-bladed beta-propeller [Chlorobi bacterium]|nr:6-bladed beta-propeller [Chlorobiota bacterium]
MKRIILLNIYLILSIITVSAQDKDGDHFSVEWIKNFSREKDVKTEEGIFSQFLNLVAGVTEEKLVKPFNLVKYDEDSYFVLDQGRFTPLLVTNDGFEVVQNDEYKVFPSLVGVCKFKKNKILFTDSKLSKIFVYDIEEEELNTFPLSQKLEKPTGIVYDKISGLIYISETANHRVVVFDDKGNFLRTIGERGEEEGNFNFPTFLTLDKNENLLVVDAMNFRIQVFNKDGNYLRSFGEAGDATGYFNRPKGIAVDSYNHIYLVDALFHTVQIFDSEGNFLYNFGGMGQLNSRFWLPTGIMIDKDNNIYIADSYNSRIQVFRLIDDKK